MTVQLPRAVATELILQAVLMPLTFSDIGAACFPKAFATDASMVKGAICWALASQGVLGALRKSCRPKGSYTRILSPAEQILQANGMF